MIQKIIKKIPKEKKNFSFRFDLPEKITSWIVADINADREKEEGPNYCSVDYYTEQTIKEIFKLLLWFGGIVIFFVIIIGIFLRIF